MYKSLSKGKDSNLSKQSNLSDGTNSGVENDLDDLDDQDTDNDTIEVPLTNSTLSNSSSLVISDATTSTNSISKFCCCLNPLVFFYNYVAFGWLDPLLKLGNKQPLESDDIPNLVKVDSSQYIYNRFLYCWNNEKVTKEEYNKTHDKAPLKPSLIVSLVKGFGLPFLMAGFFKFVPDICQFISPLILNRLIRFLSDPNQPASVGYNYVIILFFTQLVMSLCLRQYFWWCYRVGLRLRTAVITSVYNKSLNISMSAMNKKSTGEITNLMSVDSTRLQVRSYDK